MSREDIKMLAIGSGFIVVGLLWLVLDPERLPGWLQLDSFARHRVLFALLTIALGAFVAGTALLLGRPS